jgi:hypothetical protein
MQTLICDVPHNPCVSRSRSEIVAPAADGASGAAQDSQDCPDSRQERRTIFPKVGVGSRTQAVLWGVDHGFTPDHHRIEQWRGFLAFPLA